MIDKKMSDEQIIKAFEKCITIGERCEDCPFCGYTDCNTRLKECFLDLINRKDAELYVLNEALDGETVKNMRLKHEVERLKAEIRNTDNALASLDRPLIEVKHEAYKEFAERLEEIIPHYSDRYTTMECGMGAIRYLLKELTGNLHGTCTEGGNEPPKNDFKE